MSQVLLFDLDGTLLRSDRTISARTIDAVNRCRSKGYLIGVSTSRSESNSLAFLKSLLPDMIISSGGAMVTLNGETIITEQFSGEETDKVISAARELCGDINITVDTADKNAEYYRNFVPPQDELEKSWGKSILCDFHSFGKPSLKICVEIADPQTAAKLAGSLPWCDCIHFTDGDWYKFTRAGVTKETAINKLCAHMGISTGDITAFGDDLADIGMLKMCGIGIAMGNALPEVKAVADLIIGSNDDDGIAEYLENTIL